MKTMNGWLLALGLALVLTAPAFAVGGDDDEELSFDEAELFLELNDTDGDLGIHSSVDGGPWKRLSIHDPKDRRMLAIVTKGRLRHQGLTQLFFESAEPTFDELDPKFFFRRFPEGIYEIEGRTQDGEELENEVELTHLLPAPAGNVLVSGIPAAEDCDAELPLVPEPVVISWDPVTESHPTLGRTGEPVEIVRYQFFVEREDVKLSVDLPPTVTEFQVPEEILELGEEFKFEIIAREASGNNTAVESCFELE